MNECRSIIDSSRKLRSEFQQIHESVGEHSKCEWCQIDKCQRNGIARLHKCRFSAQHQPKLSKSENYLHNFDIWWRMHASFVIHLDAQFSFLLYLREIMTQNNKQTTSQIKKKYQTKHGMCWFLCCAWYVVYHHRKRQHCL